PVRTGRGQERLARAPGLRVELAGGRSFHPVGPRRLLSRFTPLAQPTRATGRVPRSRSRHPPFSSGPDCPSVRARLSVRGFDGGVSLGGSCSSGGRGSPDDGAARWRGGSLGGVSARGGGVRRAVCPPGAAGVRRAVWLPAIAQISA